MSNTSGEANPENDRVLEFARYELEYRRKKQWDIFSWTATILVSVIGGMIVLTSKEKVTFDLPSRGAMAVALFCLTIYAAFWIWENIEAEDLADNQIKNRLNITKGEKITDGQKGTFRKSAEFILGYVPILLAMGVAAIAAVLLINIFPFWFVINKTN